MNNCKYLTYKEWKHTYVLQYVCVLLNVSTLPIRNGNRTATPIMKKHICHFVCKYLTYKEWKLLVSINTYSLYDRKYLTYKEWKQFQQILWSFADVT